MITASRTDQPSVLLAGSRIPMTEMHNFPISFRLGKDNIVTDGGKQVITTGNMDLYITAKMCPSESGSLPCKDSESIFEGRGISRMLVDYHLYVGDGTAMNVRAAASIDSFAYPNRRLLIFSRPGDEKDTHIGQPTAMSANPFFYSRTQQIETETNLRP